MNTVIFPESATSDQSNPLKSLPQAKDLNWNLNCLCAVFPSFWVGGSDVAQQGLFPASSAPSIAGTDLTPPHSPVQVTPELQDSDKQLSSSGAHPKDTRPFEVTRCICWKADMISLGKYL